MVLTPHPGLFIISGFGIIIIIITLFPGRLFYLNAPPFSQNSFHGQGGVMVHTLICGTP